MPFIYAMSDIHGCFKPLEENLSLIDLSDNESKLVFCGDYIDYGPDSSKVLYKLIELCDKYPRQIVVLMGNHEYMFLEFLSLKNSDIQAIEWLATDKEFKTVNSFISSETKDEVTFLVGQGDDNYFSVFKKCVPIIKNDIMNNQSDLIQWLKKLPYYYETDSQIFVHAGIDEEVEDFWMHGTSEEYFVSKYPASFGKFYKDIIAGHINTSSLAGEKEFHSVYWDGKSHYFIDGETNVSGAIPLLKYDTLTRKYSSFKKKIDNDEKIKWVEYKIGNY